MRRRLRPKVLTDEGVSVAQSKKNIVIQALTTRNAEP